MVPRNSDRVFVNKARGVHLVVSIPYLFHIEDWPGVEISSVNSQCWPFKSVSGFA